MRSSIEAGRQVAVIPPPALDGEVIGPGDNSVVVSCAPHPLKTETIYTRMRSGLSISEIMARVQPNARLRRFAHVSVGDWRVPRDLWRATRPKPGTFVTIRMVPQGGGGSRDILRIVLLIAVLAIAVAIPYIGPLALFLGPLGVSLLAAGVAPCGNMLVGQLRPPRRA